MLKYRLNLDGLLTFGAYTDEVGRTTDEVFQSGNVLASLQRQLVILPKVSGGSLPPR